MIGRVRRMAVLFMDWSSGIIMTISVVRLFPRHHLNTINSPILLFACLPVESSAAKI
jgi:hypothetical protein